MQLTTIHNSNYVHSYYNSSLHSTVISTTADEDSGEILINNKHYATFTCHASIVVTRKNKSTVYASWEAVTHILLHKAIRKAARKHKAIRKLLAV
jgi:hypothetical protein